MHNIPIGIGAKGLRIETYSMGAIEDFDRVVDPRSLVGTGLAGS